VEVLDGVAARAFWARISTHVEVPGTGVAPTPSDDGSTYVAHLWRSGRRRALGFQLLD
jgi:hypothetical protein